MIRRTNDAKHNQNEETFQKEREKIISHNLSFLGKEITVSEVQRTNESRWNQLSKMCKPKQSVGKVRNKHI